MSRRVELIPGCLVTWQPHGVYGVVEAVQEHQVTVVLDNGKTQIFAIKSGVIARVEVTVGTQVTSVGDSDVGVVVAPIPGQPHPTWKVSFPGRTVNVPERALRPAEISDPLERLRNGRLGRSSDFNLKAVAADLWYQHLHNELVSLAHARVDLRPHQVGVVHRVISSYPHRFLLCDEVGLGKTIEAAMVVKELRARNQARRVLILVPSGLQSQWQFELKTKFNETFAIYNKETLAYLKNQGVQHPWVHHELVIASHTWASWNEHRRAEICAVDWDLVIVDEAHHAREQRYGRRVRRTNLYRLVRELIARPEHARRAALLLTATPMQLQRHELYSLVDMIDPILFVSEGDFAEHVTSLSGLSGVVERLLSDGIPDEPEQSAELMASIGRYLEMSADQAAHLLAASDAESLATRLHQAHRLSEVLIRNRRATVGGFQPRTAFRWRVIPTEDERDIYRLLQRVLSEGFDLAERTGSNAMGFLMTTFQRLATSSSRALLASLQRRLQKVLRAAHANKGTSENEFEEAIESDAASAEAVDTLAPDAEFDVSLLADLIALLSRIRFDSKAIVLAERLYELFEEDSEARVLIFTQFRETQSMLHELLTGSGWNVHLFHGQLSPIEKDTAVEAFRDGSGPQILVSTEAGGEGRNFQFCHLLVNYDLPWNPMKVEQRIGRVDRIGQEHPVVVFNLFVEGTIEERVLEVLEQRIRLFTDAIGGLEPILGEVEADIRKAVRSAGEAREEQLRQLAERTGERVKVARQAERQMADLILDTKSFGAEITRIARGEDQPISQKEYERFLMRLLGSANTYLEGPSHQGVYKLMFHAPLTIEHPELIEGRDKRRVCFDPRSNVDSEIVEYMGFGHPIIDALAESRIEDWHEGSASVRRIAGVPPGWQFNWLVTVGGIRRQRFVHPVFVTDAGQIDRALGPLLLESSRSFDPEDAPLDAIDTLDLAHDAALVDVGALLAELDIASREDADARMAEERARIEAVHRHRKQAAQDKLDSTRQTLQRLEDSDRPDDQSVVPLWRANVERAEAELSRVDRDRDTMLADLQRRLHPEMGYELLNVARILAVQ